MAAPLEAPRGPRRLPTATMPNTSKPFGRGVVLSVLLHLAVIIALLWHPEVLLEESKTPGGAGPRGGGGGGGSSIVYARLDFPQTSQNAKATSPTVSVPVVAMPDIKIEEPKINLPEVKMDVSGQIRGSGQGTGGDKGQGTGTGGGIGGGVGTGTGNDKGPGTGGDGGEIFTAKIRYAAFIFDNIPRSVKGHKYDVYFSLDETGRILDVQVRPGMGDQAFFQRFIGAMREWTFEPGYTRDGRPVKSVFKASLLL